MGAVVAVCSEIQNKKSGQNVRVLNVQHVGASRNQLGFEK